MLTWVVACLQKHYCIVFLVEYTSVSKLMGKLEKGKVKSKDEVLALSE